MDSCLFAFSSRAKSMGPPDVTIGRAVLRLRWIGLWASGNFSSGKKAMADIWIPVATNTRASATELRVTQLLCSKIHCPADRRRGSDKTVERNESFISLDGIKAKILVAVICCSSMHADKRSVYRGFFRSARRGLAIADSFLSALLFVPAWCHRNSLHRQ